MKTQSTFIHLLFSLVIMIYFSCDQLKKDNDNTLLNPWIGPYEGIPAFDQVRIEDVEEAILSAMTSHLEEIQTIADNTAPPTFENTIVSMERSGYKLERAYAYYGVLSRNQSTPEFRDIQKKLALDLSDYRSKIIQNERKSPKNQRF